MPNTERKALKEQYPLPKVPATRTPQLDPMMKPEASSATKTADKQLAKVQTLLLDSMAPLASVVESHNRDESFKEKEVIEAVKAAIQLVGNANAHMSHLRRERVVCDINRSLLPIIEDDKMFREATPLLFGTEFAKKGKEMVDQVKAMRSTISKNAGQRPQFFRGGPPRSRGGLQEQIRKGRSPILPLQGKAVPDREKPIPTKKELNLCVPLPQRDVGKNILTNQFAQLGIVPILADHLPLAGRLQGLISTWKVITSDLWVVNTVRGYRIDFLSEPQQSVRPHTPQYPAEQEQLIVEEVKELLGKGAIVEVHNPQGGFYSNLFLVPKKDGGQRLVINLKALNSFVQTEHFKMEGIQSLVRLKTGHTPLIFQPHLPHTTLNSLQPLCGLSHSQIIVYYLKMVVCMSIKLLISTVAVVTC